MPARARGGGGVAEAFGSAEDVTRALAGESYLADRGLATSVYLAATLEQPLLLEGEAGVGKTEVARALAGATGSRLIRLQCHEGIDLHHAVYDWDYGRQLLAIRAAEAGAEARELFGREFLLRRPLLQALEHEGPSVLLIDEIDRADDEFEAFLLELLSEFQITIPEIGPVRAEQPPLVVLTSNRTRELHDALKRRRVARARRLGRLQVQQLAGEVPVVEGLRGVDSLVTLQPNKLGAEYVRQG